jgi:hypothetical protein
MFMPSFFEIPKGVLEKIDYFRSIFFWQNDSQKKKYMLTNGVWCVNPRTKGAWNSESGKPKPILIKQMAFQTY